MRTAQIQIDLFIETTHGQADFPAQASAGSEQEQDANNCQHGRYSPKRKPVKKRVDRQTQARSDEGCEGKVKQLAGAQDQPCAMAMTGNLGVQLGSRFETFALPDGNDRTQAVDNSR